MTAIDSTHSFLCDFKLVYTEIKHKIMIINTSTTISEVLDSIKNDIKNKFDINGDFEIIHSYNGENGHPIAYSNDSAINIFKPCNVFYIRKIEEPVHECPVCYTNICDVNVPFARFFQCEHTMCHSCHNRLNHRICPLCRAPSRTEYQLLHEPDFQPEEEPTNEDILFANRHRTQFNLNNNAVNNNYYLLGSL